MLMFRVSLCYLFFAVVFSCSAFASVCLLEQNKISASCSLNSRLSTNIDNDMVVIDNYEIEPWTNDGPYSEVVFWKKTKSSLELLGQIELFDHLYGGISRVSDGTNLVTLLTFGGVGYGMLVFDLSGFNVKKVLEIRSRIPPRFEWKDNKLFIVIKKDWNAHDVWIHVKAK